MLGRIAHIPYWSYGAVLLALILYGVFGQPTPDQLTVTEFMIAALLFFGAGLHGFSAVFIRSQERRKGLQPRWFAPGQLFAVYGLTIPLLLVALYGHSVMEAIRDLIAFVFLLLPMVYWHLFREARGFRRLFFLGVIFIGVAFSARTLLPHFIPALGLPDAVALYLTITPAVLFAALYCIAASAQRLTALSGDVLRNVFFGLLISLIALIPIFAIAMALQRASVAAIALFVVATAIYILLYRPETFLRLAFLFAAALLCFLPEIHDILLRLEHKHIQVGLNSRKEEFLTVLEIGQQDLSRFLFGHGWGALFQNPAVGDMWVGYTHNLFSYYFFKTGLLGTIFIAFYWGAVFWENLRILKANILLGLSLLCPLLISTFFYASHKAFSYGLLILLICAMTRKQRAALPRKGQGSRVEHGTDIVYSK